MDTYPSAAGQNRVVNAIRELDALVPAIAAINAAPATDKAWDTLVDAQVAVDELRIALNELTGATSIFSDRVGA